MDLLANIIAQLVAQMPKPSEILIIRMLEVMKAKQLTHQALADLTGIGRTQISKYLAGSHIPGPDNLAAIASALKVSCDSLLGLEPVQEPPKPREPTQEEILFAVLGRLNFTLSDQRRALVRIALMGPEETVQTLIRASERKSASA